MIDGNPPGTPEWPKRDTPAGPGAREPPSSGNDYRTPARRGATRGVFSEQEPGLVRKHGIAARVQRVLYGKDIACAIGVETQVKTARRLRQVRQVRQRVKPARLLAESSFRRVDRSGQRDRLLAPGSVGSRLGRIVETRNTGRWQLCARRRLRGEYQSHRRGRNNGGREELRHDSSFGGLLPFFRVSLLRDFVDSTGNLTRRSPTFTCVDSARSRSPGLSGLVLGRAGRPEGLRYVAIQVEPDESTNQLNYQERVPRDSYSSRSATRGSTRSATRAGR